MFPVIVALATTPSPATTPDESIVTPGPLGFAAIAFIGVAVFLLVWDMLRRIRRARYREEVNAELDAEEQARAAAAGGETDDDIDPTTRRN
ncbi:hypothetical protein QE410_001938 [Microbacterium sp. SORGH_AS 1204]|uniref:hypothetical protein n=1 Tax=Microbacterium sp. SORGH_AS_1204 TaxID=3041785 RepID=UPI00278D71CA|nr:hypothetical protein [Microbacterium sp. SORGH_AS_1204]MDQ1137139.1 hypothetical protein [Microbacterium sp. SORGH_AS_1204]